MKTKVKANTVTVNDALDLLVQHVRLTRPLVKLLQGLHQTVTVVTEGGGDLPNSGAWVLDTGLNHVIETLEAMDEQAQRDVAKIVGRADGKAVAP